ncbi:hypothetical protein AMECASPLE_032646 [Ameca splendens]|uniref:Nicolin-1 n=1 Tax=Ameca splendens TaxID=208324 RepID=A0ABV0Z5E4_9TELE
MVWLQSRSLGTLCGRQLSVEKEEGPTPLFFDMCVLLQMLVDADHVVSVRLILRQPSCAWLTFSLEEIKIFPHMEPEPKKEVSDWLSDLILVDQHLNAEGLPDPQTVSSSIQQMWALTEVMQTNQTTASIGRFDVDGCYDINLLSLT